MTLECTLVRGPAAADLAAPEELSLAIDRGTSGAELQSLLREARNVGCLSVAGQDLSSLTVGCPPLVSGAVLVDGQAVSHEESLLPPPLLLLIHTGPGAGSVFPIQRGRYRIGRGAADITIPDPGLSRNHAVLDVSSTALSIKETDSRNPVVVDGIPIRRRTVTSSSTMRCGNTTFTILSPNSPSRGIAADAGRSVAQPFEVHRPASPANRWAMVAAAGLPLMAGVGLALVTGMWMFLGFTAVSAVSLLVPMIAGRRGRREFRLAIAKAACDDAERRGRCSPSAAEVFIAASTTAAGSGGKPPLSPLRQQESLASPSQSMESPPGTCVRIGTLPALANIRLIPDDAHFVPPPIGIVPLTLDPQTSTVRLSGQRSHVDGLVRFIVMQLACFPDAASTPVIILGGVDRLPLCARFLPHVTLVTSIGSALEALKQLVGQVTGWLIILEDPLGEPDSADALRRAALDASWRVMDHGGPSAGDSGSIVEIAASGTSAVLHSAAGRQHFVPDMVPEKVFDAYCRRVGGHNIEEDPAGQGVPAQCSLDELLPLGPRAILRRWSAEGKPTALTAVLGKSANTVITFDFHSDGPHLLVGGTTGSGKSELLRTLVASLALNHSPDQVVFLFVDFKGGSGLGPLVGLPHCVGLLTDLGSQHLDRALASLRGEIRYREKLFAEVGASDLPAFQRSAAVQVIPRLVIVIDEFRMLVDEAPAALRELMRIAAIGRSLGLHLVMATQRPQGALTADIRANVTSSIALRVQSDGESMDIINSKAAASIGVDVPGRGYLAKASGKPEEFQTAFLSMTASTSSQRASAAGGPSLGAAIVNSAVKALQHPQEPNPGAEAADVTAETWTETVLSAIRTAWRCLDRPLPRRPVAPPLPDFAGWDEMLTASSAAARTVDRAEALSHATTDVVGPLGLVDRPEHQALEPLLWSPSEHGHLAMIGSGSSGMPECFQAASAMLATQGTKPHFYILDATGMLGGADGINPHGAIAGLHQLPLAVRVLERLTEEMTRRRMGGGWNLSPHPHLVLVVAGWCSWAAALRTGRYAWAEDLFQDIIRDGTPLGITVMVSGDRELVSSRFFPAIPNRAFFPAASTDESRFRWPRMPRIEPIAGRAFAEGNFVQGTAAVTQFRTVPASREWPYEAPARTSEPPFRLRPLPQRLSHDDFFEMLAASQGQPALPGRPGQCTPGNAPPADLSAAEGEEPHELWIGVGGDEALPVSMPYRHGGVGIVLGGHRSGKSSILATLKALNPQVPWISPGQDAASFGAFWGTVAASASEGTLDPASILLVDDVEFLDTEGHRALAHLVGKVQGIIMTATSGPALLQQLPLVREVQASGMGLVLAPRTPLDGDILGVRVDVNPAAGAGSGFVVRGNKVLPFQAAFAPKSPDSDSSNRD